MWYEDKDKDLELDDKDKDLWSEDKDKDLVNWSSRTRTRTLLEDNNTG